MSVLDLYTLDQKSFAFRNIIGQQIDPRSAAFNTISVMDAQFGAKGDGVTDDTAAIQAALNVGGKILMGGRLTYKVSSANLTFISNTELWIEQGTTLWLAGVRLTALNVNDVQIHNHGIIKSTSLNTTDSLPTNWQARGIVEFGGTIASPAQRVGIDGPGTVFGDFVGTPGSGPAVTANDLRRGIVFSYVISAWAKFNNVYGTIAEAILYNGTTPTNDQDVDIIGNRVHDCNHDGISGLGAGITSIKTRGNTIWKCAIGIEMQYGDHRHNLAYSCTSAGYSFGGNTPQDAVSPTIYSDNIGIGNGATSSDFDLEGAPAAGGTVIVENNISWGAGAHAFIISYAKTLVVTGNKAFGWGAAATGVAYNILNNTTWIFSENIAANEGANSIGGIALNGTGISGPNNVTGVTVPYYPGLNTIGQPLRTSIPTTITGATYTLLATDRSIIANKAGTITLTLESAANNSGKEIMVRTIQAQTVVSASSNVVPRAGGAAGTAILAATAGNWALLHSDGTNWQIMAGS